ncbi:MAG: hypothetical protein LBR42_02130 [Candidatus Methanoplasma sp.]|jgi:hypothetical protein|nr:hypothetical protein [Candidatus Methanoplasma sp.]
MVKIKRPVWAVSDVIGMAVLTVGALGIIGIINLDQTLSAALIAIGIIVISVSSAFIQIDGMKLRKEHSEYQRFDEIKRDARLVPNDLKEGYLIDYTAEPSRAISYKNKEPEPEAGDSEQTEEYVVFAGSE